MFVTCVAFKTTYHLIKDALPKYYIYQLTSREIHHSVLELQERLAPFLIGMIRRLCYTAWQAYLTYVLLHHFNTRIWAIHTAEISVYFFLFTSILVTQL
jgi:hypothetical protein